MLYYIINNTTNTNIIYYKDCFCVCLQFTVHIYKFANKSREQEKKSKILLFFIIVQINATTKKKAKKIIWNRGKTFFFCF